MIFRFDFYRIVSVFACLGFSQRFGVDMASNIRVSFIGTAGIPNRYGGFEAFLEHCAPEVAKQVDRVCVTCYSGLYVDKRSDFNGVQRIFIPISANGGMSVIHDLVAFFVVFFQSTHIFVLGVSGGVWFPLFRFLCGVFGKKLLVNIDGVEWKRTKFSPAKRVLLRIFDGMAQLFSNVIVYDNDALEPFVLASCKAKAEMIAYPGDYVKRLGFSLQQGALTICRIEPENNVEMLIEGFLKSSLDKYVFVGNWNASEFGKGVREKYAGYDRLELMDPVYDPEKLAELREACSVYIHGHSVGGTNPSLVEMIFYDCRLLCFDVAFHRKTAGECAEFFKDAQSLGALLDQQGSSLVSSREGKRRMYSRREIAKRYVDLLK